jgi:hypothetical protein
MKKLIFCVCAMALIIIGCALPKPMYYWGNYPHTLYAYKKAPSEATLQKHKQEILKIIQKSKELEIRVPPGVYGEYGFILAKSGDKDGALKYFELEQQTYPESKVFINVMKSFLVK